MPANPGGFFVARALLSTSAFTTVFPTTSTVTSSSTIAGCSIMSSAPNFCRSGYYSLYGSMWQETCGTSYSGNIYSYPSTAYTLNSCIAICADDSQCTAVAYSDYGESCALMNGHVSISGTSNGNTDLQVVVRLSVEPCVSTWVVTETGTITSTEEVIYTVSTPTPTPSASTRVIASSAPVAPSSIPVRSSSIPVRSSSIPVRSSSIPVRSSSIPVRSSSIPVRSSSIPVRSSSIPISPSSIPVRSSSIPPDGSNGGVPLTSTYTSTYTVTETRPDHHHHQKTTTYLTTETIISTTTICPEGSETTVSRAAGAATTTAQTSAIQNASAPAQDTEAGATASTMTTSTVYVTEIDVITACPPSVPNCPVRQASTYTTTKTIATQMTTYLVAVTDSVQASRSTNASGQLATASILSQASAPSSSPQKSGFASSGFSQVTLLAVSGNSVSGQTPSSTMSASSAIYPGKAPKMAHFSALFIGMTVLFTLLFI